MLYIRKGVELAPLMAGGGQEGDRRSGTENVAGIVGLGAAAEIARAEMADDAARLVRIRNHIVATVAATIENAYLIGDRYRRLPGHICLGFDGQEGEAIKLLMELDEAGIAVSSGSACSSSHAGQPSHVLEAIGFDAYKARGSLRITLGRFNTLEEADRLLEVLPRAVASLRPIRSFVGIATIMFAERIKTVDVVEVTLPGLDCGLCGYRTCDEFRGQLASSPEMIRRCIHLSSDRVGQKPVADVPLKAEGCATCAAPCGTGHQRVAPRPADAGALDLARQSGPRVRLLPGAFSRGSRPARDHPAP